MSYQEGIEAGAVALRTHRFGSGAWVPQADRDDTEIVVAAFLEAAGTPIRWCEEHDCPLEPETDIHVGPQSPHHRDHCWAVSAFGVDRNAMTACSFVSRLLVEPKEEPQ